VPRQICNISTNRPAIPSPPPDAIKFPRKRLDIKFAVLLMRSTYEAVDALDFIPMDKFQVKFWKQRQSEYESYVRLYEPLKFTQGDLADPLYFDFIAYSQYTAISREIQSDPPKVFQESQGAEGPVVTVRRAAEFEDNAKLPAFLERGVGDRIYEGMRDGFRTGADSIEVLFGAPRPCGRAAGLECAVAGAEEILKVFQERGYCLKAAVTDVRPGEKGRGGTFHIRVEGPATLWGLQRLESRLSVVYHSFHSLAIAAFLRASGYEVSYSQKVSDTGTDEEWLLS